MPTKKAAPAAAGTKPKADAPPAEPVVNTEASAAAAAPKAEAPKSNAKAKAAVVDFIVKNPTSSDQTVAAEVDAEGVNTEFVQEVRDSMGARHTWPKPKED